MLIKDRHRNVLEQVQQEIDEELKGAIPTFEDIPNLKRCKNAIMVIIK